MYMYMYMYVHFSTSRGGECRRQPGRENGRGGRGRRGGGGRGGGRGDRARKRRFGISEHWSMVLHVNVDFMYTVTCTCTCICKLIMYIWCCSTIRRWVTICNCMVFLSMIVYINHLKNFLMVGGLPSETANDYHILLHRVSIIFLL